MVYSLQPRGNFIPDSMQRQQGNSFHKGLELIYTKFEEELNVSLILQIQNKGEVR